MGRTPEYKCSQCGKYVGRSGLTARKVQFLQMGVGGRVLRSRVTAWLCALCLQSDEDYNRDEFTSPDSKLGARLSG